MRVGIAVLAWAPVGALGSRVLAVEEALPNSYIARANGNCAQLEKDIDSLKWSVEGFAASSRQAAPRSFNAFQRACYVSFRATPVVAELVAARLNVEYVEQEGLVYLHNEPITWGLDRIDQANLPLDNAPWGASYDGQGQDVYVIDTGLNENHEEFRNDDGSSRAKQVFDAVGEPGLDKGGHGTHTAGTIAGKTYGIARKAKVYGIKVFIGSGATTATGVVDGINKAVQLAGSKPSIISMSLGGFYARALHDAALDASAAGHIVVTSSGNNRVDACRQSPASAGGLGRWRQGGVVTVNAADKNDGIYEKSNYGNCTDIYAPGVDIVSASHLSNTGTAVMSGTSMSCPHVSGVLAILMQATNGNKMAALEMLFSLAVPGKITQDMPRTPNLLVQVPRSSLPGTPTLEPSVKPTPSLKPTPLPTGSPSPAPSTKPPTRAWTCNPKWFGTSDGCDCECGGGDPDCATNYSRLYCKGKPATSKQFCDFLSDTCVLVENVPPAVFEASGRSVEPFPPKEQEPLLDTISILGLVLGGSLVVAGALIASSRKFASNKSNQSDQVVVLDL